MDRVPTLNEYLTGRHQLIEQVLALSKTKQVRTISRRLGVSYHVVYRILKKESAL